MAAYWNLWNGDSPATMTWLESIGFFNSRPSTRGQREFKLCDSASVVFTGREWPDSQWDVELIVGTGVQHVTKNPTQGDVLRCLDELGIKPKDQLTDKIRYPE